MSTSSDPALSSVAGSWRALLAGLLTTLRALGALLLALARAPFGCLRRPHASRPTPASRIPIEVHLTDPAQAADIEQAVRATLIRCARTWAPRALPFDRVEVLHGAPPRGQASTFTRWGELPPAERAPRYRSLTVLSLGLTDDDGRALEIAEIAGAVAVQVRSVLTRRYMNEHSEPGLEANREEMPVDPTGAAPLPPEPTTPTTRGRAARPAAPSSAPSDPAASGPGAPPQPGRAGAPSPDLPLVEGPAGEVVSEGESSNDGAAKPLLRLVQNAENADPLWRARPRDHGEGGENS